MLKKFLFYMVLLSISINLLHAQPIKIHKDNHFLSTLDNQPFFWLADTGWELFHRLDREEVQRYIKKRKAQGFNIIQAVVLYELQAFEAPNAYNDFPLVNGEIEKINLTDGNSPENMEAYDYWDHVKYIMEVAAEHDMIIGLLPCWGEYVTARKREPTIKTTQQGYDYGNFIGDWLKDYNDNIVWVLGGDRLPDERPKGPEIWRAMAEGITDAVNGKDTYDNVADYNKTFMTFHCYAPSSRWFAEDAWIDMHTWGSYHERRDNERAFYVSWAEWDLKNYKPFVNSEPAYENLPINYDWANVSNGKFDDFDVRQIAYWSVFSGCAGHTYGAHEVWMMFKTKNLFPPLTDNLTTEWEGALEYKGGYEMKHLKDLILSYDFYSRKPDLEVLAENLNDPTGRLIACSGKDYVMVYAPTGKDILLDKARIDFDISNTRWFDPRNGKKQEANYETKGDILNFEAPGEVERGNDWVLIVEGE